MLVKTKKTIAVSAGILACAAILLIGCGKGGKSIERVLIDGSSTVYPITEAIDKEFEKTGNNSRISVGISGTTGGFKKFAAGEIDIANASRPIKKAESAQCALNGIEFIEADESALRILKQFITKFKNEKE